ncbi:hypothetical protein ASALC70_00275 [Alcanivorax sp. ALC70]|nr:hypothetical protein ASALC70_00275 [Alcanivorax sp. ALC70]
MTAACRSERTHRRCVPGGQHRRFGDTVQTGGGGTEALIDHIGLVPFLRVVTPALPDHAVLFRHQLVDFAYPRALDTSQLVHAASLRSRFAEPLLEHTAYNLEPQVRIEGELRLIEQLVGAGATGLPAGIKPDASLANPDQQGAGHRGQLDRRMGDTGARFQHDARHRADGNVHPLPVDLVDHHEGAVFHINAPVGDEHHRNAILDGNGFERHERHGQGRRIIIMPKPKALERPRPCVSDAKKASGSVTSSLPL